MARNGKWLERLEGRTLLAGNLVPDDAFGIGGFTTLPANTAALSGVIDAAGAPSGKVVVIAAGAGQEVIRYHSDGSIDESFGVDGRFLLGFPGTAIEAQPDGSILVAGVGTIIRLDANGDLDDNFGAGGIVTLAAPNAIITAASDIRVEPNGDITLLSNGTLDGASTTSTPAAILNYLNFNGSVDSTFAPNGRRVIALPVTLAGLTSIQDTALATDDGVLISGTALLQFGHVKVVHVSPLGAVLSDVVIDEGFTRETVVTAIDTDEFGNIAMLSKTALSQRSTVSIFASDGDLLEQAEFPVTGQVISGQVYDAVALGTQTGGRIILGFDDYAVGMMVSGQVAAGVYVADGVLTVRGGESADDILINRSDPQTLRITRNGKRTYIARSQVSQIVLSGAGGNDVMTVNVDIPVVATGDLGDDVITTAGADDRLSGGDGNDSLLGNGGKDILVGGVGADKLWGGSGKDRLAGEGGKDRLYGGSGDDQLDGGAADDVIYGESGNDKLFGGRGNDTLNGGSGTNEFYPGEGDDILA